jgi:5-methyltetrahydrofolate--homocysteine methyltransferase
MLKRLPEKFFPLQIVTVGDEAQRRCLYLYSENKYKNYLYLHGFAVAVTEALAEYSHRLICAELGLNWNDSIRISPGYPVWPNLTDQEKVVGLLEGKKIGVSLTETYQLVPEFSTTAMILL